jgi:hypothetical protein
MERKDKYLDSPRVRAMQMLRKVGLVIMALVMASSIGCIPRGSARGERAVKALEEKYAEPFELKSYSKWASGMGTSEYIDCYPLSQPDLVFSVEFDGEGKIHDTYLDRKIGRELENIVIEKAAKHGFTVEPNMGRFLYVADKQPAEGVTDLSLQEYLAGYEPEYLVVWMLAKGKKGSLHGSEGFMQALQETYDALGADTEVEILFRIITVDEENYEEFAEWIRANPRFMKNMPGKSFLGNGRISFAANPEGVEEFDDRVNHD